ncbi:DUF294 nucleotidyltransferase-like domain-containing protein [Aliidiomarina haloalkalitolerans]|uniref:Cyclic nucleotide-binding protein n=1 Tax=Aliidiomarina haloalkalitolerans TaxID=859059 RepID=A0A432VTK7_9GAMM|nr:DUF294 nucleotidyltransferase-like domain-containing protein [Aliidiomarina haloalkalitolerans]RUO19822.1 cyclic nucleotide-binding protein [Aliidiomarina haloalkalitolerans]
MHAEQTEILHFLERFAPFNMLPREELEVVATSISVGYVRAEQTVLEYNQTIDDLHIIRSGEVEVLHKTGELYNRLTEGGYFGEFGLLRKGRVRYPVRTLEDTLLYYLPRDVFTRLFDEYDDFAEAVEVEEHRRVQFAVKQDQPKHDLLSETIDTLISRETVTIDASNTIREAAELMTNEEVSSLLIMDGERSLPVGIITDKDLRKRVLAVGRSDQESVHTIMSSDLVFVQYNQRIFEAMLLMLRTNLHHLPVLKKGQLLGVIALSDVVRHESKSSLFVVSSIFKQNSIEELQTLKADVQASFVRMVNEDANSRMIGASMASIGRSFKQRLLELAEAKLGPPPVPYCFIALGSMARDEQAIVTDQDNALILDDSYQPSLHDEYFVELAQYVTDGLDACGYPYCSGGIMATNPEWRQPLSKWREYFTDWIETPTPERLLHSNIFFDLDAIWGEKHFADELNQLIQKSAPRHKRFLASMAKNAVQRTPPLGFFKDFVMEKDGKQNNSINMKRRGTAPLVDLVRVHALSIGSTQRNTFARLEDIIEANILPHGRGPDLRDAYELIAMVRIRQQARAIAAGEEPDNNIHPDQLSDFERKTLKDAFQILSHAQKYLRFRYSIH